MKPPSSFKRILVATDFSEASRGAVDTALTLASSLDARVTLMHAAWMPPLVNSYAEGLAWPIDAFDEVSRKELRKLLEVSKVQYPNVDEYFVVGEPSAAILDAVTDAGADLLVLGTHAREGLARAFIGSVAEKVLRQARVPVLIVSSKTPEHAKE
ncbi:MAG: universal stress protein [Polyangiaceae bacterium]